METLIPVGLCLAALAVQLLLCFKVKRLLPRLAPLIASAAATAVLLALAGCVQGWDALGYLVLGLLTLALFAACFAGWMIWLLTKLIRRIKEKGGKSS